MHDHHDHEHHDVRDGNKKGLAIAFGITFGIMLLEFFGGLFTNSLALLADSGHMLSDAGSLALSFVAIWFASRAATKRKTYGYHRFEILAALFNGVTLFVIAGIIVYQAYGRFFEPQSVASGSMILIAFIGLAANLLSAWFLIQKGDVKDNVNLRSAYLHVLGDALGSVGAIIAGIIMYVFGWYMADPIISVLVSLLILKGAWGIIKQSVHVLMEGTPLRVNQQQVKNRLESINGVVDVHDLHIWTITSNLDVLTCHLRVEDGVDEQQILQEAVDRIEQQFNIVHTTIQIESARLTHEPLPV